MNLVNQGRKLRNAGGECVWELGLPLYMVFTCELFMQSQGCSLSAECPALLSDPIFCIESKFSQIRAHPGASFTWL